MEVLGVLFLFALAIATIGIMIGSIVFIARDAGNHDQNVALWIVLYIFFGNFILSIYMFVTKRTGWGLFWLIVYPTIIFIAVFFGILFVGAAEY